MPLTVRLDSPSGGGSGVAEDLTTTELDVTKYLAPDGAGGVQWLNFVLPNVENLPTAELDTTRYLAPDGAGGLVWTAFPVVDHNDLSGVTPDQHHAQQHLLGGADHSGDILANVNTKVSDYDLASVTKARMDFYVRDDIGDDANPGTLLLPLKTITEAEQRIPDVVAHPVVIHLGVHPVGGWLIAGFRERSKRDHIVIIGDGAGTPGIDGFTEIVGSTAALVGSDFYNVVGVGFDAAPRGGFGAYSGYTIEILTGAAAGDRRTIRRNTTTNISPFARFSASISAGDLYRIVTPSIEVNGHQRKVITNGTGGLNRTSDNVNARDEIPYPAYVLCNVYINNTYAEFTNNQDTILFLGVRTAGEFWLIGCGSFLSGVETYWTGATFGKEAGNEGVPLGKRIFATPLKSSWVGWGLTCGAKLWLFSSDIYCKGMFFSPEVLQEGGFFVMEGGGIWEEGIRINEYRGFPSLTHFNAQWEPVEIGGTGTVIPIQCNDGIVEIEIAVLKEGRVRLVGSAIGIRSKHNGQVRLDSQGSRIEITAPTGFSVYENGSIILEHNDNPIMNCGGHDFTVNGGLSYHAITELSVDGIFADSLHGRIARTDM